MKLWMVTGGTSGLGADLVQALARPVWRIGRKPKEKRDDAIAHDIFCDVANWPAAITAIEQAIWKAHMYPEVLINCAGANLICRTAEMDERELLKVFCVNTFFPLMLTARLLEDNLFGPAPVVINVGSSAALHAGAFSAAYVASKHALSGVTKSLAKDYGDRIKVYQINFGKLHGTDMSNYIDSQQARLRGTTVSQERERQKTNWKNNREIPLRAASQFIIEVVDGAFDGSVENGGIMNYGC